MTASHPLFEFCSQTIRKSYDELKEMASSNEAFITTIPEAVERNNVIEHFSKFDNQLLLGVSVKLLAEIQAHGWGGILKSKVSYEHFPMHQLHWVVTYLLLDQKITPNEWHTGCSMTALWRDSVVMPITRPR